MSLLCLGIESTAHTFGASLVDDHGHVLSDVNDKYRPPIGQGIHPRKAAQHHADVAANIIGQALAIKNSGPLLPDTIAFSAGPGLGPCLRVGATVARALALYYHKPLVPVHHGVAHLDLAMLGSGFRDPLAVLVSGGHTAIGVHIRKKWRIYGETQDITLGNLIDMFARSSGLPSPGGPTLEQEARKGTKLLKLPYTVKGNDVAYSGLLTAASRMLKKGESLQDVCYSVQEVGFAMLAEAVERSLVQTRRKELLLAGGVAANNRLKEMLQQVAHEHDASFHAAELSKSGDCGLQIAWSGQLAFRSGITVKPSESHVVPRWRIDEAEVPWIPIK